MANIDDVVSRLVLQTDDFKRNLQAAEGQLRTGTANMGRQVDGLGQRFSSLQGVAARSLSAIGGLLTGGAIIGGLTAIITRTAHLGDELDKLSIRTGCTQLFCRNYR